MPVVLGIRPSAAREASSSSVRNALPPPRRTSSSVSAGSGAEPRMAATWAAMSEGAKALQLDPLDRGDAHDLGDPREQRVAPVQLVAAVGDHDRARPAAGPDEVADQVERGGVGPVQVLEHDHQRAFASRSLEQRAHGIEDPARDHGVRHVDGTRVGEPRGQAGHEADEVGADAIEQRRDVVVVRVPEQAFDHGDDRRVRERHVDDRRTAPDDHANAELGSRRRELGHQATLADAGLTADHDRSRVARRAPEHRGPELLELRVAAHDHRARDPAGHDADHTHRPRVCRLILWARLSARQRARAAIARGRSRGPAVSSSPGPRWQPRQASPHARGSASPLPRGTPGSAASRTGG